MNWMLKNSANEPDGMFTVAIFSWLITAFCIVAPMFNGVQIPWSDYIIKINAPSETLVAAFLGATFTSYVVRRKHKLSPNTEEPRDDL